jgi:hypothetical protein
MFSAFQTVLAILGAVAFVNAGVNMLALESQAGNTVAELFDHNVGYLCIGLAWLSLAYAASAGRQWSRDRAERKAAAVVAAPTPG